MTFRNGCSAAVAFLALFAVNAASAQDISPQARKACSGDYRKLCPGVRPGEGRVVACFEQHMAQLSPQCKAAMREGVQEKRPH